MRSFLSRLSGDNGACLKIQLKNDFIFLRGAAGEAAEQPLNGTLNLRLPCGQPADGVRLRMVGFLRCRSHDAKTNTPESYRTIRVFEHEWPPFVIDNGFQVSHTDSFNTYEWPFEFMVPGDTPESFRGCSCCSVSYQLTATTMRSKSSASTPQAYRPLRINRTPRGDSAFELMDAATAEGTWAGRVEYRVSLAHRAVALGTGVPLEVILTPLRKGLRVERVRCEMTEQHTFRLSGPRSLPTFEGDRTVGEWDMPVEDAPEDTEQPSYRAVRRLPLPADPKKCSPDTETENISTSHTLHVEVNVVEEGDNLLKSRYHVTIPVVLFMSPELPVDASENFVRPKGSVAEDDGNLVKAFSGLELPPCYGLHLCDKMLEASESIIPHDSRTVESS
ncbi:CreD [Colletotrichum sojae]|uniref:CreD n=1 Tax=Colletotrichum sojae TaxID=2175907 RepID=A0A8H6J208_9PEZI|nr:CreD [Colletotrichum sojae]